MTRILEMDGIRKSFDGVEVLHGADFDVASGEVHAMVGENGAGKSTLMKILAGVHAPDTGTISLKGQPVRILNPHHAQSLGISIIHQELNLIPDLSVAENLFLGREPVTPWRILNRKRLSAATLELMAQLDIRLDPWTEVRDLTLAQQQLVEILKALSFDANILIMDEPTAALAPPEVSHLFQHIERLKERGKGIIFISHHLHEVFEIAQRVTVLKDGAVVATRPVGDLTKDEVVRLMVGRQMGEIYPPRGSSAGQPVLEIRNLSSGKTLADASVTVRAGEIVGVAGLEGQGQRELVRALFGAAPRDGGQVMVKGQQVRSRPWEMAAAGVAFVSEDRKHEGLILDFTVCHNASLTVLDRLRRFLFINGPDERRLGRRVVQDLGVHPPDPERLVRALSGGNQQKVVLGKWLETNPSVLVLHEPTRGVDVGARAEIYQVLRRLTAAGTAVLVVSSDLPEVIGLSDRIYVMRGGRIAQEIAGGAATEESIMFAATGVGREVHA